MELPYPKSDETQSIIKSTVFLGLWEFFVQSKRYKWCWLKQNKITKQGVMRFYWDRLGNVALFVQDPWPLLQLLQGSVQLQSGKYDCPAGGPLIFSLCAFTELLCCWHGCQRGNWRHKPPLDVLLHKFAGRNAGISVPQQVRDVLSTLVDFAVNTPKRHSTPGFSICSCLTLANAPADLLQAQNNLCEGRFIALDPNQAAFYHFGAPHSGLGELWGSGVRPMGWKGTLLHPPQPRSQVWFLQRFLLRLESPSFLLRLLDGPFLSCFNVLNSHATSKS